MSGIINEDPSLKYNQVEKILDEVTLVCSRCNKELVDVCVTNQEHDVEFTLVAECPCGDKSFQKTINGMFRYSPKVPISTVEYGDIVIFKRG